MGVDPRRAPPLPAPTETETNTPTELTVDAIKPTDGKSTVSIPEDGTPVTIPTRHKASKSQTSLLIEYFEGGKTSPVTGERRPSVRVRLTPSKKSRGDHIQVTKGTRKASLTKRIPLDQLRTDSDFGEDANSMSSYASATEESNVSRHPIEVEIDRSHRRRRPASPLIPTTESYPLVNPSQISEIPSDSFLDGTGNGTEQKGFGTPRGGENLATAAVAGAAAGAAMNEINNYKSRTGKKDRVKVSDKSREQSDRGRERKHRSKSRTSSVSERGPEEKPRRRSSRGHQESVISGADSSVMSSNLTPSHRSGDTHSTRNSAVSKSSINNPKLLETVEDAIRRLILPELSALKREQSKRESRRSSFTSSATTTTTSKEDALTDRRRSGGARSDTKRNREARHDYGDSSPLSVSRESFHDGYNYDTDPTTPKQSGLLKAAAAGAAAGYVGKSLASGHDDKVQSEDRKQRERRRRRTESARSRSLGRDRYADDSDDDLPAAPRPIMPLMSEINPSEMTRTSILSADTDRPHSASEEMTPIQHVSRGLISPDSTPTPTRTPANLEEPFTQHANVSHGDLTALPRGEKKAEEYEEHEMGQQVPMGHDQYNEEEDVSDPDDYPDNSYEATYFATQEVPPPLKYVPYQAGARGLSPIPSVSGYTEGGSEYQPRHSRSMHSTSDVYSSLEKSGDNRRSSRSTASLNSLRDRGFDPASPRSSGVDYRNTTYTDDSELDRVMTGQAVQGVGANPNFVHPPMGVESNVASLIDGSMLDQSVLTSQSGYSYNGPRDSQLSYDDQSRVSQSSRGMSPNKRYGGLRDSEISYDEQSNVSQSNRGVSPDKRSIDSRRDIEEERHATPSARSYKKSQEFSEYELDEHGRKVPRTRSPTASEAAITAGAVGAAAAALRAAKEQQRPIQEEEEYELHEGEEEYVPAGVFRNKSFKERTLEGHEPRNTPAHSIDRLSYDEPRMSATGIPDWSNPMPEYGYVDDDITNPSVVEDRLDGERMDIDESGRATPTQKDIRGHQQHDSHNKDGGLGITEAAAAAGLGAAAGMAAAHAHSREPSHDHDEWHRTSDEKKRDTLVTNPYEDASPIANPVLNENLLSRGLNTSYGPGYHTGSPGFGQKYDEGYMSNGPNRTPEAEAKGKGLDLSTPANVEDPFYVPKDRHYSGLSQGMASPFYDAATGQGIERIENKDIVALMQHLTVRDAQRSARDTEIIALLMNAALEMRNSFREMKDLIQDTGDDVIFAGVENTEKLTKAINGPRPYPGTRSSIQSVSQLDTLTDAAAKKKNFLKRALQGLSARGTSDLSRIEDMLMQLLGEVDVLKTQTAPPASTPGGRSPSLQPEGQYEQDRGYEPEGNSTASHASQSGHLSLNQSRNPSFRLTNERKFSDHRISTVEENEEEYQFDHPSPSMERTDPNLLTPRRLDIPRGGSVPLDTPPQHSGVFQQPLSAENTPRTEKGKKHKSTGSSSWLPKISRWSGTTASSVGKAFRSKKEAKYDDYPPSRSGSSLASYNDDLYEHNPYEEDKLHSGFSEQNLDMPSQPQPQAGPSKRDSLTADDPKYKAHRNSLNLQHPQPRPGQTERFRNALEHSAQEYDNPMTPRSTDWAGSATSLHRLPANANRYSNGSSAAQQQQQQEQWPSSPTGPPLPPKEPMDSPSTRTPPRSNRVSRLAKSSPVQHQSDESGYGTMSGTHPSQYTGSPKPENRNLNAALGIPTRRPSGPRSMTPKSPEQDARDERRRKRDTFGTIGSHHTDDTDTF